MEEQLYCGAAREKITPPEELLPNLRGLMDSRFGGVVDDLYIRVIALKQGDAQVLLVSGDLDKLPDPEENLKRLEEETGISREHILYISIHTHSAPVTGDRPYEGPNYIGRKPAEVQEATRKYEQLILEKLLTASRKALKNLAPATMEYAYGTSDINVNRIAFYEVSDAEGQVHTQLGTGTNFRRPADHTLFVMRFVDSGGRPIAFFINYPVHNTVMIQNGCGKAGRVGISSDLGGNVSQYMEEEYQGCVAMWSSGAAGDLNPLMSNEVYREDLKTGAPVECYEKEPAIPLAMLHTLAAHHFADVKRVVRKMDCTGDTGLSAEACPESMEAMQSGMDRTAGQKIRLSAGVRWAEVPGKKEDGSPVPYKVRVQKIGIGPVMLVGVSGELYSELGREIREACGCDHLILINHNASLCYNAGYIYSDEAFALAEQYAGNIVGMNHTWLRPGYIGPELIRCVQGLLAEGKEEPDHMKDHCISQEAVEHIQKKIWDVPYAGQSPSQILDLWYPNEESEAPYPVIVHFHGGGFSRGGHREDSVEPMLKGTDRGYVVVSVEYRKSGEARFPAMLYDAKTAIRFLKAHAEAYHLDADRIALWGPSAGGWIAAMAALTAGNPAMEDLTMGYAEYDSQVAAVVDWCGPCGGFLDMDAAYQRKGMKGEQEHSAPDSPESEFLGAPLTCVPELVRMADPCVYVHPEMPPFIIVHGTADAIVPVEQSIRLADTIRKIAGEEKVEFHMEEGVPHHGRIWWHEDYAADLCFDFLDRVLN